MYLGHELRGQNYKQYVGDPGRGPRRVPPCPAAMLPHCYTDAAVQTFRISNLNGTAGALWEIWRHAQQQASRLYAMLIKAWDNEILKGCGATKVADCVSEGQVNTTA